MFKVLADVVFIPIQKCKEIKKQDTPWMCVCARVITMHVYVMYTRHDLQYHNMVYVSESKSSQNSTVQHIYKSCAQQQAISDVNVVTSLSL
jgi:hypothetical protein